TVAHFLTPSFIGAALLLGMAVSILAGAYPAFVLSNTRLVSILKSGLQMSHSGGRIRKMLIVFQYVIAVFLITATIIVLQQMSFIQRSDLGYNREQIMVVPVDHKTRSVYEQLKNDIKTDQ